MKPIRLTGALLAAPLILAGCQSDFYTVSLRFGSPHYEMPFASNSDSTQANARLTSDGLEPEFESFDDETSVLEDDADYRIALWGEPFNGEDVTDATVELQPGQYRFALRQWNTDTTMQGSLQINPAGGELAEVFRRWKESIPEHKKRLAYRFELDGKLSEGDPRLLRSLMGQLRAFDALERQLDAAIRRESRMQENAERRGGDLLQDAIVLVFPTPLPNQHDLTRPTFNDYDLAQVRAGEPVTKLVLMADHRDVQMKLEMIDRLAGELRRCRDAAHDEARRLERRKQLYSIIFRDHADYVANEKRLAQALEAVDELNRKLGDLRERRLALAFTGELVAPDASFRPLDEEQRDLDDELAVLRTEKQRLDATFAKTAETNPRRATLQRQIQRYERAIAEIDDSFSMLADARAALTDMRENSTIVRRHGGDRLLAASCVGNHVPYFVRDAIQREACMTIRLETIDGLPVPDEAELASYSVRKAD